MSDERRAEPRVVHIDGVATPMCSHACPRFVPRKHKYGRNVCAHGETSPVLCMPAALAAWRELHQLRAKMSRAASCPHKRVLDTCEHCDRVATRAGRG